MMACEGNTQGAAAASPSVCDVEDFYVMQQQEWRCRVAA